jgi:hypothetical protein
VLLVGVPELGVVAVVAVVAAVAPVAPVVELGSWPQLTTVTTWPKYLESVKKNKDVEFFSACWPQRSVRHEGDGRIFKIDINVEYNTLIMLRYHNSVEQALSFDPFSFWASRRNTSILRFMEPKSSFPFKDLLCPRHQLSDDENREGPWNVCLHVIQTPDAAASPRIFYWI